MIRSFGNRFSVRVLPVLKDNYSYIIHCAETNVAGVVDVSQTKPVLEALREMGVAQFVVLTTHKHWDHSGGNKELLATFGTNASSGADASGGSAFKIYGGSEDGVPGCTHPVRDGDTFSLGSLQVAVLHTPCHTSGHVVYHVTHPQDPSNGAVFTGDTMFVGGIGAFFEGDAQQMVAALRKITALPDPTAVYPGHNYTVNFLKFSAKIDPEDKLVAEKLVYYSELDRQGLPTVPSTVGDEKQINMFARTEDPLLKQLTGISDPVKLMQHLYDNCD